RGSLPAYSSFGARQSRPHRRARASAPRPARRTAARRSHAPRRPRLSRRCGARARPLTASPFVTFGRRSSPGARQHYAVRAPSADMLTLEPGVRRTAALVWSAAAVTTLINTTMPLLAPVLGLGALTEARDWVLIGHAVLGLL